MRPVGTRVRIIWVVALQCIGLFDTGAEDENVPFLVLKYGANFAEIQRNTALVLSQIQQNSSYIF